MYNVYSFGPILISTQSAVSLELQLSREVMYSSYLRVHIAWLPLTLSLFAPCGPSNDLHLHVDRGGQSPAEVP
jgi:hypothetical protein